MACDICGKEGTPLVSLRGCYQTEHIKEICGECKVEVDNQMWRIKALNKGFIEKALARFMGNKKRGSTS